MGMLWRGLHRNICRFARLKELSTVKTLDRKNVQSDIHETGIVSQPQVAKDGILRRRKYGQLDVLILKTAIQALIQRLKC